MKFEMTRLAAVGGPVSAMRRGKVDRELYSPERNAAYRRLAVAILGLDVPTMAQQIQSSNAHQMSAA